ncbi:hypothetical protein KX729_00995 [Rhizobium sp. XQZ8]|uniref:hypothetical protein n=1 Tax=Rhizobium populisoli TaxID=2859785 RepID=UPI001CA4FB93|nr:hypothetical protein [Rhizobium populisoli]MBW6420014.1 hypothetical protein [Rhizobium populisoli]
MSGSNWFLQDLTPERICAVNARISRSAADLFDMPSRCRRRSCRRGQCSAALSAESHGGGEPECVALLGDHDRAFFGMLTENGRLVFSLLRDWQVLPVFDDKEMVFLLREAISLAVLALYREPATRLLARVWLRRIDLPPAVAPTLALARVYRRFGEEVDVVG